MDVPECTYLMFGMQQNYVANIHDHSVVNSIGKLAIWNLHMTSGPKATGQILFCMAVTACSLFKEKVQK